MSEEPSSREVQCLRLLELPGASYGTVAESMGISESTVRRHLSRLYEKLGVNSALQARAALERRAARTVT